MPKPEETTVSYEVWDQSFEAPLQTYQVRYSSDKRARESAVHLAKTYNRDEAEMAAFEMRRPRPDKFIVVKATTTRERL